MTSSWFERFTAQPHQPFFALGIPLFLIYTFIIMAQYSNILTLNVSLGQFHIYPLVFMIFIQFFLGFLFVVFPRFLMQATIKKDIYMKIFYLYLTASLLYFCGLFISNILVVFGSIILFCAQAWAFQILYKIYKNSIVPDKYDTKWILISYATGLFSHLLFIFTFIIPFEDMEKLAIYASFYLFLFSLIFAISQRMILMFTKVKVDTYIKNKSKYIMEITFTLLLFKVLILMLNDVRLNIIADLPLFLFFTYEIIYKWKLPVFKVSPIMWVLYLALFWIPLGFLLSFIESLSAIIWSNAYYFEKSAVHTFALGYFVTVLIGFGTRVVLGHSGKTPTADSMAVFMFICIQFIVLIRVFAGLSSNFGLDYTFWISLSALLLVLALILWSIRYLGIIIKGYKP